MHHVGAQRQFIYFASGLKSRSGSTQHARQNSIHSGTSARRNAGTAINFTGKAGCETSYASRHGYDHRYILHLPLQRFMIGVVKMTRLLLALSRTAHGQLAAAILIVTFAGQTFAKESLEETVNYLIDHVAKSDATFIHNGVSHTPAEAVAHIKAKRTFQKRNQNAGRLYPARRFKKFAHRKAVPCASSEWKRDAARCMADRSFETISD
jgi:hypothetical protein